MKFSLLIASAMLAAAQGQSIVIRAGTVLDGTGRSLHHAEFVVEGGKIRKVGLIDAHVQITWGRGR